MGHAAGDGTRRAPVPPGDPVDDATRRFYEQREATLSDAFESVSSRMRERFDVAFREGGRVLDIGAGPGRETAALAAAGYEAWAVEPVAGFREQSVARHPELAGRVLPGALPDALPTTEEMGGPFDGVLLCAVLQHVSRERVPGCAAAIARLLVPGGAALISVPRTRPGIHDERDAAGRLFTGITADEIERDFAPHGFDPVRRWSGDDAFGRPGHSWVTVLLELRA